MPYRKAFKDRGLCAWCGKAPPEEGRVFCPGCAAKNRAAVKKRRRRMVWEGSCTYCGGREAESGGKTCGKCRAKLTATAGRRRRKYREEGRCVKCGAAGRAGKSFCGACLEKL